MSRGRRREREEEGEGGGRDREGVKKVIQFLLLVHDTSGSKNWGQRTSSTQAVSVNTTVRSNWTQYSYNSIFNLREGAHGGGGLEHLSERIASTCTKVTLALRRGRIIHTCTYTLLHIQLQSSSYIPFPVQG